MEFSSRFTKWRIYAVSIKFRYSSMHRNQQASSPSQSAVWNLLCLPVLDTRDCWHLLGLEFSTSDRILMLCPLWKVEQEAFRRKLLSRNSVPTATRAGPQTFRALLDWVQELTSSYRKA